jgi:hypothetical protein
VDNMTKINGMSLAALEQRVTTLERQLADLKAERGTGRREKDWRRTLGMFSGDEVMKQIDAEARKFREADRKRTKPRARKAPRRPAAGAKQ